MTLQELAREVSRVRMAKKDYLVPSSEVRMRTDAIGERNVPRLNFTAPDGTHAMAMTESSRRQLAERLRIPFQYFRRMQDEQPELLDRNVNTWLEQEGGEARMVRTLDDKVRAVLSRRYRPIDNWMVAEWVLPHLQGWEGARVESCDLTETKMYLKIVLPRIEAEVQRGDVVQAGLVVGNSETGHGSLYVQPLIFRLVCTNGMIASDHTMRRAHIGRLLEVNDDGVTMFGDDTLRADDRAFALKLRDVIKQVASEQTFRLIVDRMRSTLGIELGGHPAKSVEILGDRYSLTKEEQGGVLRHLIEGGDLSGYGLLNAVTAFAQDVADYDRATELEAVGGRLLDLTPAAWKSLSFERAPLIQGADLNAGEVEEGVTEAV